MGKLLIRLIGWIIAIYCFYALYEAVAGGLEFLK